jgi:hypothetical protein
MTTYTHSAEADLPADALFGFLADPRNLPKYFSQMTEAEPTGGETVHVEAEVHGEHVEGEAWVRPDPVARRLEWGAEGPDDYRGELLVEETDPGRCRITVSLHSVREAGDEVQQELERTVAALAQAATAADDAARRPDADGPRG